ncbi:hypothetical protein Tco_1144619 [Tanacetum coccineum]
MIIKKDFKIVKAKGERKSLALKGKKEYSYKESSTSGSEEEEYAMAVRDFKKFLKGRGSDSSEEDDEKAKDETCLIAHASSEVHSESSYFSVESSLIDDHVLDSEYDNLTYNGGNVIFGSNLRGNIIGKGQICDNKCKVIFSKHDSEITKDGKFMGRVLGKAACM